MSRHYLAVNRYRSQTDPGFSNTWTVHECSAAHRRTILAEGLPLTRACDPRRFDGGAVYSTQGIRAVTPAELAQYIRDTTWSSSLRGRKAPRAGIRPDGEYYDPDYEDA